MLYSCCFGRHLSSFGDFFLQSVPHLQALTFLISFCRPCSSCFRWQVVTTIWHCGCTPCANFWGSHRSCHWFVLQWRRQVATLSSYGCHCACVGRCCCQADRCHACGHSCDSSLTFTRHGHAGHLTCELQWHLYMVSNLNNYPGTAETALSWGLIQTYHTKWEVVATHHCYSWWR